ncbi:MAG: carbohydrate kinase family protein [Devosia sp.]
MARILVTGNINRDRTIRLQGALPGCRIVGHDTGHSLGGAAANTGMALARGGHHVVIASGLGHGPAGDAMLAELVAAGVDVSCVARLDVAPAEPLILIEPSGERTIIHLVPTQGAEVDFDALQGDWDAIYAAMPVPGVARLCARYQGRCPILGQWYPGTPAPPSDILVTSASASTTPQRLADLTPPPEWLIVTEGAAGARAEARDGRLIRRPAVPATEVRDTTGAGDVYAAGILHGMVAGWPLARAMDLAAALAARQVKTEGPTPPEALSKIYRQWSEPDGTDPRADCTISA